MRRTETRGTRRPSILDRPRVAYDTDARGRRRARSPRETARLLPVRVAVVLDAATYLALVLIQLVPGPPGFGLWLTWPLAGVWILADLAAWEGSPGGLKARAAFGGVALLGALAPVLRGDLGPWPPQGHAPEADGRMAWWCVGALVASAIGTVTCLNALRRPRLRAPEAPSDGVASLGLPPLLGEVVPPPATRAPPARAPGRAARVVGAFGVLWILGGVVEALRGIFWFGLVEIAVGVGWLLCRDTLLDPRTERRLVRTDRASVLPVLLIPLGGLALLVRAAWLLGLL